MVEWRTVVESLARNDYESVMFDTRSIQLRALEQFSWPYECSREEVLSLYLQSKECEHKLFQMGENWANRSTSQDDVQAAAESALAMVQWPLIANHFDALTIVDEYDYLQFSLMAAFVDGVTHGK